MPFELDVPLSNLKTVALIPDCHRPFHHKKAYALMIFVLKTIGIDAVYIMGDYLDFYYVNGHGPKYPGMVGHLKDEVEDGITGLDELDAVFPDAKKVYIEGNHEYRLARFIQNKAPELFGLVDIKTLLKMETRPGWNWVSYGPHQKTSILGSKLWARHEPNATRAKLVASGVSCSITYGHIHRAEQESVVALDGSQHVAFCSGWLGDKRKDEVFGYVKGHFQWQLGFAIVRVDPTNGLFYHQIVPILPNMTCVVDGIKFELPNKKKPSE